MPCGDVMTSCLGTEAVFWLCCPRRGCQVCSKGSFKGREQPSGKLEQQDEREPVGEREREEHLATVNHSDLPDTEKTKIKQHEIVAGPANVPCSLRALVSSDI